MATMTKKETFRCFNDCRMEGCPSHEMEVLIQTTSDVMIVSIDGEQWFGSDPSRWETLQKLLGQFDYAFFPAPKEKETPPSEGEA